MNTNTPRTTTIKEEVITFLSENKDVVNPLIIAKGIKRKLSLVRREMDKMIADGILNVTYDSKNFFTSIKVVTNAQEVNRHAVRDSTGRFAPKAQSVPLTEAEAQNEIEGSKQILNSIARESDKVADYPTSPQVTTLAEENQVEQMLDDMKIPYTQLDPNADAVAQNEEMITGEDMVKKLGLEKKDSFWSKILKWKF